MKDNFSLRSLLLSIHKDIKRLLHLLLARFPLKIDLQRLGFFLKSLDINRAVQGMPAHTVGSAGGGSGPLCHEPKEKTGEIEPEGVF